jgi:hypothetical protein
MLITPSQPSRSSVVKTARLHERDDLRRRGDVHIGEPVVVAHLPGLEVLLVARHVVGDAFRSVLRPEADDGVAHDERREVHAARPQHAQRLAHGGVAVALFEQVVQRAEHQHGVDALVGEAREVAGVTRHDLGQLHPGLRSARPRDVQLRRRDVGERDVIAPARQLDRVAPRPAADVEQARRCRRQMLGERAQRDREFEAVALESQPLLLGVGVVVLANHVAHGVQPRAGVSMP